METTTDVSTNFAVAGGISGVWIAIFAIYMALMVLMIVAMWKLYTKAGQPGWGSIIPIYNVYLMFKIAGKPGWWLLLLFVPIANIVVSILMLVGIANAFGKGGGYVFGLLFLPFIFYPMLAFGDATYTPPATA
jgi:hypothetical protein